LQHRRDLPLNLIFVLRRIAIWACIYCHGTRLQRRLIVITVRRQTLRLYKDRGVLIQDTLNVRW
jgi:hypothetical protein